MKYILLYNPVSGKGKFRKKVPFIKKYFKDKNLKLDIYESMFQRDLETKAMELAGQYDVLIISGGDGTVNEVINGVMKSNSRPAIAILPSGTANDVASLLGFNKNIKRSLKIITESEPVKMDVNKINNHYFVYAIAAGLFTRVSYHVSRKRVKKYGYLAYLMDGARDIFNKYKMDMEIITNGKTYRGNYMLALGLSSRRVAGFFLFRFSKTKLDDGRVDLRLIKSADHFRLGRLILFFITGGKKRGKDVHLSSNEFIINTSDDIVWNTDGEKSAEGSIKIEVYNKALLVYASKKSKKRFFNKTKTSN